MSNQEFYMKKDDTESEGSIIADNQEEYNERIKLLSQFNKEEVVKKMDHFSADLQLMQQKIVNQPQPMKQITRKTKNFVPVDKLQKSIIIHMVTLYKYTKLLEDRLLQAKCVSQMKPEYLSQMREADGPLSDRLGIVMVNFNMVFRIHNPRYRILTATEFVMNVAYLLKYLKYKVRLVRAFNLGNCPLDYKFRVKAVEKVIIVPHNIDIFKDNAQFLTEDDQIEDLDAYAFGSKVNQMKKSKGPKISKIKQINPKKINNDIQEVNDCLWLEIFWENEWIAFDPISDYTITLEPKIIKQKLHHSFTYFVMTTQDISFDDKDHQKVLKRRLFRQIYFTDVTHKYLISYQQQRIKLSLQRWFNQVVIKFNLFYKGLQSLLKFDYTCDLNLIPFDKITKEVDVKYHLLYTLKSQLTQYLMIKPDAVPIGMFKEQEVYSRKDITILHTRDKWRVLLLSVKQDQLPVREITNKFNQTKVSQLYAHWQTEPLNITLDENNGQLPRNNYGNYETFCYPPPQGTCLLRIMGIMKFLDKLKVSYVEAISGFDQKNNRQYVSKCGYLVFKKDLEYINEEYEIYKKEQRKKAIVNKYKSIKAVWSQLFKQILLKKELAQKYGNQ